MTAMNSGMASLVYSSIGHLSMPQTANMATPTGGVMPPKVTQVIMTRPKCTGSIPRRLMIGIRMGVSSRTMTVLSRNMPSTMMKVIRIIISRILLLVMLTRYPAAA